MYISICMHGNRGGDYLGGRRCLASKVEMGGKEEKHCILSYICNLDLNNCKILYRI